MLEPPFDLIACSWPRPVQFAARDWISDPEWDAPPMPLVPQPRWAEIEDDLCWTIDWRHWFRGGVPGTPGVSGRMRGFHIIFRIRVRRSGTLVFWDDDGCLIRHAEQIVHCDPVAHPLTRHELPVREGDVLEIAQWQQSGNWLWGAHIEPTHQRSRSASETLLPFLDRVQHRMRRPNGPPLKYYTHGAAPARAVVALYSLILNGYTPSKILLYGEDQWSTGIRELFAAALPFVEVVPASDALEKIRAAGGEQLTGIARQHWFVMKACLTLLCPPTEFGLMDDDVFILDRLDDALTAFRRHDLVFQPDKDHSAVYVDAWGWMHNGTVEAARLPTGTFNAGLYWMRNTFPPRKIAQYMLQRPPDSSEVEWRPWRWEQGMIALLFAKSRVVELPTQRYFYPLFDGIPGGFLEYDYRDNPCGFASIHYGGAKEKPHDSVALSLAPSLLGRSTNVMENGPTKGRYEGGLRSRFGRSVAPLGELTRDVAARVRRP